MFMAIKQYLTLLLSEIIFEILIKFYSKRLFLLSRHNDQYILNIFNYNTIKSWNVLTIKLEWSSDESCHFKFQDVQL